MVAILQLDRLQYEDIRRVLDVASRIARRKRNVRNDGISRVERVDLAAGRATQLLVLAHVTERHFPEGGRLSGAKRGRLRAGAVDGDTGNASLGKRGDQGRASDEGKHDTTRETQRLTGAFQSHVG